jgi:hypothetical protein
MSWLASRRKAFWNEGNLDEAIQSYLIDDSNRISNLDNIGISLGGDSTSVKETWAHIKHSALGAGQGSVPADLKDVIFEKIEKEALKEEVLEKLFLKNIYGEIMDEVMDLESDYDVILPRNHSRKMNRRKGKNIKICNVSK